MDCYYNGTRYYFSGLLKCQECGRERERMLFTLEYCICTCTAEQKMVCVVPHTSCDTLSLSRPGARRCGGHARSVDGSCSEQQPWLGLCTGGNCAVWFFPNGGVFPSLCHLCCPVWWPGVYWPIGVWHWSSSHPQNLWSEDNGCHGNIMFCCPLSLFALRALHSLTWLNKTL